MLVKWNGDGLLGVPLVGGPKDNVVGKSSVEILIPGWNEVTDANWELMALHLKDKLEDETIALYGKKEVNKETGVVSYSGQALRDVRADIGRDIVKECYSVKCLEVWAEDPKISSDVQFFIAKQIEYCKTGEGPKAKK